MVGSLEVPKNCMNNDSANSIKNFFKRWPRLYYFVYDYLGPLYFGGLSPKKFLDKFTSPVGTRLNVGSGARKLDQDIKNVDVENFPGVDIVANITDLPLADASVDAVVCDQVLEHVTDPLHAMQELHRVLKPGGYVYISMPFLYPFHASPSDFYRWTHKGYEQLLKGFEVVDIGVRSGPFSALTVYLAYLLATLLSLGNKSLYWVLVYLFSIVLSPIKLLDVMGNRLPFAINMAAVIYCLARKPV